MFRFKKNKKKFGDKENNKLDGNSSESNLTTTVSLKETGTSPALLAAGELTIPGIINIADYSNLVTSNDWTAAITKAVADSKWGGVLFFPIGVYNHKGIVITKPLNIIGGGKYSTRLVNNSVSNPAIKINANVERGTMRDISIFGNGTQPFGTDATSGKGIVFSDNSIVWTFENVWMRGHGDWFLYADGLGHVNNINLINCELEYGKKGAIHFIQTNYSNQINAINIQNCNISGFLESGLELWGHSITVQNSAIQACKKYGIAIDGTISSNGNSHAQSIRIDNNYFEGCNLGFIFAKAIASPIVRYIFSLAVTNNFGDYTVISGDTVNTSAVSIVEIQAPNFYAYDNFQISAFLYMANSFGKGNAKYILNGNNVLSYNSIIQRSVNTVADLPYYVNLGRASMLDTTGGVFPSNARPTYGTVGMMIFDSTLGIPLWLKSLNNNGTGVWVDGKGKVV